VNVHTLAHRLYYVTYDLCQRCWYMIKALGASGSKSFQHKTIEFTQKQEAQEVQAQFDIYLLKH